MIDLNGIASFNIARIAAHCMSTNEPDETGERGVILMTASIAAFETKGIPDAMADIRRLHSERDPLIDCG